MTPQPQIDIERTGEALVRKLEEINPARTDARVIIGRALSSDVEEVRQLLARQFANALQVSVIFTGDPAPIESPSSTL